MNSIGSINLALQTKENGAFRGFLGYAIGLLLYLSTTYIFSNALILAALLLLIFRDKHEIVGKHLLVGLFTVLALLNILAHLGNFTLESHASSLAVILVVFVAILAPNLPSQSIKVFILAAAFEILVGIYEISNGQVALTAYQAELAYQDLSYNSIYLYDLRVFGLSANSSLLAEKIFVALMFGYFAKFSVRLTYAIHILMVIGLVITFNRTAILSALLFYMFVLLQNYRKFFKSITVASFVMIAAVGLSAFVFINFDEILNQLFRGNLGGLSESELTRLSFWEYVLGTLAENPFTGNGSLSFRIQDAYGVMQHAHNSFLMTFATHGIIIPLFLFSYIAMSFTRSNAAPLISVMIFSVSQYFIFWNLSVPDILLFWLLGKSYVAKG